MAKLLSFLKTGTSDTLTIVESNLKHTLKLDKSILGMPFTSTEMAAWPNEDNKLQTEINDSQLLSTSAKALLPIISNAQYSALSSIRIRRAEDDIEITATDGHRIGHVVIKKAAISKINDIDVVIAKEVLTILDRLTKLTAPISIGKENNGVRVQTSYGLLNLDCKASRLSIPYPDIDKLINTKPLPLISNFKFQVSLPDSKNV